MSCKIPDLVEKAQYLLDVTPQLKKVEEYESLILSKKKKDF